MPHSNQNSQSFYDALAATYDTMIPFEKRFGSARKFIDRLLDQRPIARAIDCATGTGLYAMALAEAGVDTIGVDLSDEMIQQARQRAAELDLQVSWLTAPMERLTDHLHQPADLILCLGNSLPHVLDDGLLHATLQGWRTLLAPGGRLLIQLLNYERILQEEERIVAITRSADADYVRFYDFVEPLIRFNVLRIEWADGQATHDLDSVPLRPYTHAQLNDALLASGFEQTDAFGDLAFNPFAPAKSKTLVLQAQA